MAYMDFPDGLEGQKKRKAFFLSADGLALIQDWRRHGIPLTKIAEDYIGVSRTAFWGWYRQSEELRKVCAISKDITDSNVEDALYRRACGYDYTEEVWELVEGQMTLVRQFVKHMPPDIKAILAWLYNRRPNVWRSLQEPLESTQYVETVKNILVAMKEVAETGQPKAIEAVQDAEQVRTD